MAKSDLSALVGLAVAFLVVGITPRIQAQTEKGSEEIRKEIEKELETARKALIEKISGILSRQEERIAGLERALKEKDREIADLRKKVEELSKKAPEPAPVPPKTPVEPAKPKGVPLLGISPGPVPDEARSKLNLREGQGSLVLVVQPGSPADKVGIQAGDIILSVGGKEASGEKIRETIQQSAPGDKVEVVFLRGAEKFTKTAELVDRDKFLAEIPTRPARPEGGKEQPPGPQPGRVVLGLLVEDADAGALVQNVEPGKTGAIAQIKEGDILVAINGKPVKTGDEIYELLGQAKIGEEMTIVYKRKDGEYKAKVVAAGERGTPKLVEVAKTAAAPAEVKPPAPQPAPKAPASLGIVVLEDDVLKVVEVKPGAAAAGILKEGDAIVEADGRQVRTTDELRAALKARSAGDILKIVVQRGDQKMALEVKLGAAKEEAAPQPQPEKKKPGILGITADETEDGKGLRVSGVNEKGPADKAGIRKDDVILKVNGVEIKGFEDLTKILKESFAGTKLTIELQRGAEVKKFEVELGSPETSLHFPPGRTSGPEGEGGPVYLGAALLEETGSADATAAELGFARVAIREVYEGGPAAAADLREGDELLSVDSFPIRSLEDLGSALGRRVPGETVQVRVSRNGEILELDVVLGQGASR